MRVSINAETAQSYCKMETAADEYKAFADPIPRSDAFAPLEELFLKRIAMIDGAMGTCIQGYGLEEEDFDTESEAGYTFKCGPATPPSYPDWWYKYDWPEGSSQAAFLKSQ